MPVVLETNLVFTRGVPLTIFEATGGQLPGFFSGQLDVGQLTNVADEMDVKLEVKYTSAGAFRDAEKPSKPAKQEDKIFRFTPLEQTYGYKITGELLAVSPSANATLAVLIIKSTVPT